MLDKYLDFANMYIFELNVTEPEQIILQRFHLN